MKRYKVTIDSVAWQVMDDEAVVINTETSDYFSLNLSGTFLWQLMVERACQPQELVLGIASRYQLSETDARSHVDAFLTKLTEAQLVVEHADARAPDAGELAGHADPPTDPYEPPDVVKFGDLEKLILSGE